MRRADRVDTLWVPLALVRIGDRRRRCLSAPTVERYRQWLEEGRQAPPVQLVRHGESFLVRDGRHRVAAAVAAGYDYIEAELRRIGALARAIRTIWAARRIAAQIVVA